MEIGPLSNQIACFGDYVPRQGGIANFTHDLCEAVAAACPAAHGIVGAVNDRREGDAHPPRLRFEFHERDLDSYRRPAEKFDLIPHGALLVRRPFSR